MGLAAAKRRGRPPTLSFQEGLNVALSWNEKLNARARIGKSPRNKVQADLMKRLIRLQTTDAPPRKIAEIKAMMNAIGRYRTLEIRPPAIDYPALDREIAGDFGISERMVRRCRSDFREFLSHPWDVRAHEAEARSAFAARQLARRLMTPERLAKGERVVVARGGLVVEQDAAAEATYKAARRMFSLDMRQINHLIPMESRRFRLDFKPQWTRMDAQADCRFWKDNQETFVWEPHPRGRRVKRVTHDTGEPVKA